MYYNLLFYFGSDFLSLTNYLTPYFVRTMFQRPEADLGLLIGFFIFKIKNKFVDFDKLCSCIHGEFCLEYNEKYDFVRAYCCHFYCVLKEMASALG